MSFSVFAPVTATFDPLTNLSLPVIVPATYLEIVSAEGSADLCSTFAEMPCWPSKPGSSPLWLSPGCCFTMPVISLPASSTNGTPKGFFVFFTVCTPLIA